MILQVYHVVCPILRLVKALCGRVGGKIRSEYAMVGDVINLAARFMGKAKGRIVCDEVTHDLVRNIPHYYTVPFYRTIIPCYFNALLYRSDIPGIDYTVDCSSSPVKQ